LVVFLSFFTQVFLAIKVKTYEKVFTRGRGEGGTFICTAPVDPSSIYLFLWNYPERTYENFEQFQ